MPPAVAPVYDPITATTKGFSIRLGNTVDPNAGEKGVNAPTTVGGVTFFGTNQPVVPGVNSCQANLGTARGYAVDFLTGTSQNVVFQGGGLPPSPVSGLVSVNIDGKDVVVPFIIGAGNPNPNCVGPDCTSSIGGAKPDIAIKGTRHRTHWYQERDK